MSDIIDLENLVVVGNDIIEQTLAESTINFETDLGNGVFLAQGTRDGAPIMILGNPGGEFGAVYHDTEGG